MKKEQIGKVLKDLRIKAGLTQKELSDAVEYTQVTISQYETGNRIPSREALEDLAQFYKVDASALMRMLPAKYRALVMRHLGGKSERYLEGVYRYLVNKK